MRFLSTVVLIGAATVLPAAAVVQAQTTSAAPSAATAAAATASVSQAQFTTAVSNREPADNITTLDNSHNQVTFFTVLNGATGQTITHRWQYQGQTRSEVKFEPKANHWRVWSTKTLLPGQTGTWTVQVVDGSGNVLASKTFDYTAAAGAAPNATHKVMNTTAAPGAVTHGRK